MKRSNYLKINMKKDMQNQEDVTEELNDGVVDNAQQAPVDAEGTDESALDPLATLQKQCDEYKQGWQRALADYENLKRDLSARAEEARRIIRASLARDLLPVVDNFAQAVKFQPDLSAAPEEVRKTIEPWLQGILYIEKQFEESLKQMGVEPIPTEGTFDPTWHEAASDRQEEDKEDGAILEVMIPGWKIGDIVLRPAKVIVNKKE